MCLCARIPAAFPSLPHTRELLFLSELRKFLQLLFTESFTYFIPSQSQLGALERAHHPPLPARVGRPLQSQVSAGGYTKLPTQRGRGLSRVFVCVGDTVQPLRCHLPASSTQAVLREAEL